MVLTHAARQSRVLIRSPHRRGQVSKVGIVRPSAMLTAGAKCCVKMLRIAEDGYGSFSTELRALTTI